MNFSPYSPSPDEDRTSRSPKKQQKHQQQSNQAVYSSYQAGSDSYAEQGLLGSGSGTGSSSNSAFNGQQAVRVNKYETSLPIRVDVEASLAYVLGPVTGLLLLILERQNDYVRFHAWQSSLTFSALMLAQFILLFISSFLSWVLFFFNIFLLVWLVYRAYLDGASLERYEVPYFGIIASEYVDTE
ncbi:hypothetical protein HMPREF1544_11803 [Mucor circinelloides 1006PhL]|uniref:Uncharacterized protein n=1 Tax=Mucor circinelloides f. circinelloides (strain 1006PhL) TaxID=1220926 RepID=S2IVY9_MUCC1|nr:hypothetical protein HMPREF1544_11803 [Mucor circinelloides 1006PhL]KAG1098646.1 hypothetical protein G6F42_017955 [Rhizopus arrhizus]